MYKNYLEKRIENFEKLPMSCKELFFKIVSKQFVVNYDDCIKDFLVLNDLDYSNCKDGYDTLFNFAFDIFVQRHSDAINPFHFELMNLNDYSDREKTEFSFELITTSNGRFVGGKDKDTKLLISLHGYDEYARVGIKSDAEKDRKLKNCGYDIIRFSERELFTNPFACVMEAIDTFNDIAGIRKRDD